MIRSALVVVTALALVACGGEDTETAVESPGDGGTVVTADSSAGTDARAPAPDARKCQRTIGQPVPSPEALMFGTAGGTLELQVRNTRDRDIVDLSFSSASPHVTISAQVPPGSPDARGFVPCGPTLPACSGPCSVMVTAGPSPLQPLGPVELRWMFAGGGGGLTTVEVRRAP